MTEALKDFSRLARQWGPALLWMVAIIWLSTEVGSTENSVRILRPILVWARPGISEAAIYDANIFLRKTAHVMEFIVLALLIWRTHEPLRSRFSRRSWVALLKVVAVTFIFAAGSEIVQYFMKSRGSSRYDVALDMAGAAVGVAVVLVLRAFFGKSADSTTVLITAHPRLDEAEAAALGQIRAAVGRARPDLLVIAGNVGDPRQAERWLQALREAAGDVPVAICLGHRDHWWPPEQWEKVPSAAAVREKFWRPACETTGVRCLDYGNADLGDLIVTGGYGHFDRPCEETRGIPHEISSVQEEAARQAAGILTRLEQAQKTGKPIVLATYVPALAGGGNGADKAAGNLFLGEGLEVCVDGIVLAVHGHGSAPSRATVRGIPCAGVGGEAGKLSFVRFSPAKGVEAFVV